MKVLETGSSSTIGVFPLENLLHGLVGGKKQQPALRGSFYKTSILTGGPHLPVLI